MNCLGLGNQCVSTYFVQSRNPDAYSIPRLALGILALGGFATMVYGAVSLSDVASDANYAFLGGGGGAMVVALGILRYFAPDLQVHRLVQPKEKI